MVSYFAQPIDETRTALITAWASFLNHNCREKTENHGPIKRMGIGTSIYYPPRSTHELLRISTGYRLSQCRTYKQFDHRPAGRPPPWWGYKIVDGWRKCLAKLIIMKKGKIAGRRITLLAEPALSVTTPLHLHSLGADVSM